MAIVYIMQQHRGNKTLYSIRCRNTPEEVANDLDIADRVGFNIVKRYIVPTQKIGDALEACSQFTGGRLTAENLDARVKGILEGGSLQ